MSLAFDYTLRLLLRPRSLYQNFCSDDEKKRVGNEKDGVGHALVMCMLAFLVCGSFVCQIG